MGATCHIDANSNWYWRMSRMQKNGPGRKTARLGLSSVRASIGTEDPIPEEMDHREIAVRVPVMNEVQFLFAFEPCNR